MTITNVTSVSTIIPGAATAHATYGNTAGEGGGLSAKEMNSSGYLQRGRFCQHSQADQLNQTRPFREGGSALPEVLDAYLP